MDRTPRVLLLSALFLAAYAATYEAQNWIGVYWFNRWDPKFGSRLGNIAFGHEILPFLALLALMLCVIAAGVNMRWLLYAPLRGVAYAHALAGFLCAAIPFWFDFASADVFAEGVLGAGVFIVAGPVLAMLVLFGALRRRWQRLSIETAA